MVLLVNLVRSLVSEGICALGICKLSEIHMPFLDFSRG